MRRGGLALRALAAVHGCIALVIAHPYFPWPQDPDEFLDEVARTTGLGSAALGWLESEPRVAAPGTAEYAESFRAWSAGLR